MDCSVQLLKIERPKKQPLLPVYPSPTKITRNPNSPKSARALNGGHNEKAASLAVVPKDANEIVERNGHTEAVCKRHHKYETEFDERKHVYKTDHNRFEITVKVKKPHSSHGTSDKFIPIEVDDGINKRQQQLKVTKHKAIREGSWADILSRKDREVRYVEDTQKEPATSKRHRKEPRSRSASGHRQQTEQVGGRKHAKQSSRKKDAGTMTNREVKKRTLKKKVESEKDEISDDGDGTAESEPEPPSDIEVEENIERKIKRSNPVQKRKPSKRQAELDQLLLLQQLKEENIFQRDQITELNSQLEKAKSELQEYTGTIKELYDLATMLKNENQNLIDKRDQGAGEKLTVAIAENDLLKRHLAQLTQQHELILKPKDEQLMRLKNIVNDVKTTLEEEINDLQSLPITTSVSSAAAAKCSSASFFRNLNLTEEDGQDGRRSESSISEIPTLDDDDESVQPKTTRNVPKSTNIQNKNQNMTKRNNQRVARILNEDQRSIEDDSTSTQYKYLPINDKSRDFEQDDDLDGLRN